MRFCKECGIKVGKGKSYCSPCKEKRQKHNGRYSRRKKIGTLLCGFEGCKEPRGYRIHSCEYHSSKNRDIRFMEEIVSCNDCGCELGKRKNHKNRWLCNDCSEIRKENGKKRQTKYYGKWFKDKYHTDEEFRKKHNEYQREWFKNKYHTDEEFRKRNLKRIKNWRKNNEETK